MNCVKCGKETKDNRVFCESCLADMEKYPVKPGTAVNIPKRPQPEAPHKRERRKREVSPEEQVHTLRKALRRMMAAVCVLLVLVCVLCAALIHTQLTGKSGEQAPKTRNYTIVGSGENG